MVGALPPEVDVILPCLNEAEALGWVLGRMPPAVRPIVVDNGSTDGSALIAHDHGAYVIAAPQRGYGAACHAGLLAATAPVVAVMDADASLDPQQLDRVVTPIVDSTADLMIGRRRPVNAAAFPWVLRLANRELSRRMLRRTGLKLVDLGPMRAARREALLGLDLRDRRSGYPAETVVRAADAGWRLVEVSVDYLPRRGRSKVTGSPLGAWRAVRDMTAALERPIDPVPRAS
ncbi:MAG TPA: glycosyltransferase family 2 protein [Propionibacteriaceae bacterium]|nr:glycosyltransferase family 2 protein [Propionibacteriaceae bacterium]